MFNAGVSDLQRFPNPIITRSRASNATRIDKITRVLHADQIQYLSVEKLSQRQLGNHDLMLISSLDHSHTRLPLFVLRCRTKEDLQTIFAKFSKASKIWRAYRSSSFSE